MAKVKVVLNGKGIREMLKSSEIENDLVSRMRKVQAALPGSELEATQNFARTRVKVARGSDFDEANTGALSKALDLAGGRRGTRVKTPKPRRGV